jgi:hypothetical protein
VDESKPKKKLATALDIALYGRANHVVDAEDIAVCPNQKLLALLL